MVIFKRYEYQVHKYGHQIFFYIIGNNRQRNLIKYVFFFSINSADEKFDSTMKVNAVVQHTGNVLYVPPGYI